MLLLQIAQFPLLADRNAGRVARQRVNAIAVYNWFRLRLSTGARKSSSRSHDRSPRQHSSSTIHHNPHSCCELRCFVYERRLDNTNTYILCTPRRSKGDIHYPSPLGCSRRTLRMIHYGPLSTDVLYYVAILLEFFCAHNAPTVI